MGEPELRLVHGHGRARGRSPGFYNTNTGFLGLQIRRALRNHVELRAWIKVSTLDCSDWGATKIRLKPNASPTRIGLDADLLPEPRYKERIVPDARANTRTPGCTRRLFAGLVGARIER
jgi:hypothetical protein